MQRVARLARALQVFLERQGFTLPGPVEPVLVASSPAMHIDSVRPMVRVVLSDAVRQFAGSLLQARPVLRLEQTLEIADRIITPKPKVVSIEAPDAKTNEYYLPPGLRDPETEEQQPPEATSRARAIFHAAEQAKPFDPADLDFAFDETAEAAKEEVPEQLKEPSPSQRLRATTTRLPFSRRQMLLLGGMAVFECCILASFAYMLFFSGR
jgi:hypothetical protein